MKKPICLWSGPRNISTALMYSFAQRVDTRVIDEPLYGHYLRVTGADHPGRSEVLAAMNCDGADVLRDLLQQQCDDESTQLFTKHMAHHLIDIDPTLLKKTSNIFLIRDPREMLPSVTIQLPHAELKDTGLEQQWQIFTMLISDGQSPLVLDSRELLLDPAAILNKLCQHLNLDYDPGMLTWTAGPRREDGVWARHWYHAVHKSTGFSAYKTNKDFPARLLPLLHECEPWYNKLFDHALRADL